MENFEVFLYSIKLGTNLLFLKSDAFNFHDPYIFFQSSKMENIVTNPGPSQNDNMFEKILNNPGLQCLAENIFLDLDVEHLQICALLNQSSKKILDGPMFQDPMFWLRKFGSLSIENQNDWANVIQSTHNSYKRKYAIISYLRWNLKNGDTMDLPCYTCPAVPSKRIWEICQKKESSDEDTEIVKILAPLVDNPNAPNNNGETPILEAILNGNNQIVKILFPYGLDEPIATFERFMEAKYLEGGVGGAPLSVWEYYSRIREFYSKGFKFCTNFYKAEFFLINQATPLELICFLQWGASSLTPSNVFSLLFEYYSAQVRWAEFCFNNIPFPLH